MLQSVYAIGAIILATLVGSTMQQGILQSKTSLLRTEIEAQAAEVAIQLFERAESLSNQTSVGSGDLTDDSESEDFQSDSDEAASGWIIQDDARLSTARTLSDMDKKVETIKAPFGSDSLAFKVDAKVNFVSKTQSGFAPSVEPTKYQEVTMHVTGQLNSEVSISRVYMVEDTI